MKKEDIDKAFMMLGNPQPQSQGLGGLSPGGQGQPQGNDQTEAQEDALISSAKSLLESFVTQMGEVLEKFEAIQSQEEAPTENDAAQEAAGQEEEPEQAAA